MVTFELGISLRTPLAMTLRHLHLDKLLMSYSLIMWTVQMSDFFVVTSLLSNQASLQPQLFSETVRDALSLIAYLSLRSWHGSWGRTSAVACNFLYCTCCIFLTTVYTPFSSLFLSHHKTSSELFSPNESLLSFFSGQRRVEIITYILVKCGAHFEFHGPQLDHHVDPNLKGIY